MTLRNDEKSEEELTCRFKIDIRNLMNFDRGVMFNCTQDWCKVWRKTGLWFQKLTWGIWQIFTRALKSLEIGTLMAYFYLKLKTNELINCGGVMCHDNDEWCKIWRGIDLSVQNWHEEFDNFDQSTQKSQKFAL